MENNQSGQDEGEARLYAVSAEQSTVVEDNCGSAAYVVSAESVVEPSDSRQTVVRESNYTLSPSNLSVDGQDNDVPVGSDYEITARDHDAVSSLVRTFDTLSPRQQTFLVQVFLTRMSHNQHNGLEIFLRAMLRRDFIRTLNGAGLVRISQNILSMLDARSLYEAERCSTIWRHTVEHGKLWKNILKQRLSTDENWDILAKRRKWGILLGLPLPGYVPTSSTDFLLERIPDSIYRQLYLDVMADMKAIRGNWRNGLYCLRKIHCNSNNNKGVYCLQYDDEKIVSGLRDNTIKIWNKKDFRVMKTMVGHTGSVLCLQYENDVLITGSSDTTIRIWSIELGRSVNTISHHQEAVLHLRFVDSIMVTSSKDRTIAVWDIRSPENVVLRRSLIGHRAAVNVVDFDLRFIISASGDRTIKMWITDTCEFYRTLSGHKRGIACLQYMGDLIVSGSSDNTIRIWNAISGACMRTLEGHQELVRCIRFNNRFIVSGAYDGKIKVWDLKAALDPLRTSTDFCIRTLSHHTGRVFRLQFDMFQIVSSSHDDTILVFDFCSNHFGPFSGGGGVAAGPSSSSTIDEERWRHGRLEVGVDDGPMEDQPEFNIPIQLDNQQSLNLMPRIPRLSAIDIERMRLASSHPPTLLSQTAQLSMNPLSLKVRFAIETVRRSMKPLQQPDEALVDDIDMEY